MPKTVTPNTTKPIKVEKPKIAKGVGRIANLGEFAHPPKKKGRGK
jgi:hypothetical protein